MTQPDLPSSEYPEPAIPDSVKPFDDPGRALTGTEIASVTIILMGAYAFSGVIGLIRQMVISAAFGAGVELDAFYAAARVPETLFVLIAGGALGSAFIPVFSGFLGRDDFDGAWRLASAVMSLVTLAALLLAVIAFVFAQPIVQYLLIPGRDAEEHQLVTELMRIMLVTVIIFSISGLVMGILNAYQHFVAPAFAPGIYNIGIIGGAVFLTPALGIYSLAWGTVIGALFHLFVQVPVLRKLPDIRLQPNFNVNTEGTMEVLTLMLPRVLGLGVVQINFWVNIALGSAMIGGNISVLQTAYVLMFTILGILGQSLGTAVFPTLATQFTTNDMDGFQRTFTTALRNVLFLTIPAGVGLAVLSVPIVTVLFERGEWTHNHTLATGWTLIFYAIGLAGHAALEILARTYYALHDTWTPVRIGMLAMVLNVVLSVLFVVLFEALGANEFTRSPVGGLALANSLATALESAILYAILNRRIETLKTADIIPTLWRTLIAALMMGGSVLLWLMLATDVVVLAQLIIGIGIGVLVFWGAALALQIQEARTLPQQILSRVRPG